MCTTAAVAQEAVGQVDPKVKTTVLVSYNAVEGFSSGWRGDGRLFIHANDDGEWGSGTGRGGNDMDRATSVMRSLEHNFYRELKVPVQDVDEFFLYAGLNAMKAALELALHLKKLTGAGVTVVACSCDWDEKGRILRGSGVPLMKCLCGGQDKMADIARKVLSV